MNALGYKCQLETGIRQGLPMAVHWYCEAGHAAAQAYMQRSGYRGPLPPPVDQAAAMAPRPHGVAGHARICRDFIS